MASRRLEDLKPVFLARVQEWLLECKEAGLNILVYSTLRGVTEQALLYKIGRTVKGANVSARKPMGDTVTNAEAGQSAHNYGLALDFVPMFGGKPQWKNKVLYRQAVEIARGLNMQSLMGDPEFNEMAHLQLPKWRDHV